MIKAGACLGVSNNGKNPKLTYEFAKFFLCPEYYEEVNYWSEKGMLEGKTALYTSHRLSNITLAGRIVVIENGRLVEQGSREELLQNPGRFAELYQYQAEKFSGTEVKA